MEVAANINRKFKAILQDINGEIHHLEVFTTLNAAKSFIRRKIEETSGALTGEVQEIATEVHKVENEAKAEVAKAEAVPAEVKQAIVNEGEKITEDAKKVLDKAK